METTTAPTSDQRRHLAWQAEGLALSPHGLGLLVKDHEVGMPIAALGSERRRVCVVAAGGSRTGDARLLEILEDPAWEVWGINAVPILDREGRLRCDRWFDLHQRVSQSADDLKWIAECPVPIYVPEDLLDGGPRTVRFPLEACEERFGGYWACTFAYQIALALLEGMEEIALFGIDLPYGDARERTVEWANVSWWLGFAEGRGLKITLPAESRLGTHPHRYGIEYTAEAEEVKQYLRATDIFAVAKAMGDMQHEYFRHLTGAPITRIDRAILGQNVAAPKGVGG